MKELGDELNIFVFLIWESKLKSIQNHMYEDCVLASSSDI